MPDQSVLFYDGACPLCQREMAQLARLKNENLILADIHTLDPDPHRPDRRTLLQSLHLRKDGQWITGLEANIAAWQYTHIGWLWRWLQWPVIWPLADRIYRSWARKRYARRYPTPPSSSEID